MDGGENELGKGVMRDRNREWCRRVIIMLRHVAAVAL